MSASSSALQLAPILRCSELRTLETNAGAQPLMERAGLAAAQRARALANECTGSVLVLAGPGNNGGDAFVVARWLRSWFFDVTVVFNAGASQLPADAAAAHQAFIRAGGHTVSELPASWRGSLIIDGLLGIGLTRALSADYASIVKRINAIPVPVLALDVPSGLNADTGMAAGVAIRAAATATFIALKPGLVTGDGVDLCGDISVHALELDHHVATVARGHRLDWNVLAHALPPILLRRDRNVHKGTFGTLAIIGGAEGMAGAALLAGRAAMKLGAGKVWVGFAAHDAPLVDWTTPELMLRRADSVIDAGANAMVVGPGLGTRPDVVALLTRALQVTVPIVLDADALNLIAANAALQAALRARTSPTILTPHPAEAGRLLGCDTSTVQRDRVGHAQQLASAFGAHVVLKGAGSVLAHQDGTWDINASGNPGLSTAGSGDVLAGFVGALLAQGVDTKTALRYAVCLHGAAADALVGENRGPIGLLASDLCDAARKLINAPRTVADLKHSSRSIES